MNTAYIFLIMIVRMVGSSLDKSKFAAVGGVLTAEINAAWHQSNRTSMVLIIALADKKGLRIGQQEHTKSARKHTKSARRLGSL